MLSSSSTQNETYHPIYDLGGQYLELLIHGSLCWYPLNDWHDGLHKHLVHIQAKFSPTIAIMINLMASKQQDTCQYKSFVISPLMIPPLAPGGNYDIDIL